MTRSVFFVNTRLGSRGAVSFPFLSLPQTEKFPPVKGGEEKTAGRIVTKNLAHSAQPWAIREKRTPPSAIQPKAAQ